MTRAGDDIERIEVVKAALLEEFGQRSWFRGAGVVPGSGGLALRINVDPDADLGEGEIPESFRGFPVEVVRIGLYRPRGEEGEKS